MQLQQSGFSAAVNGGTEMRLYVGNRTRRFLRRTLQFDRNRIAEGVLVAAMALQCARLIWMALTPIGPAGDWRAENRAMIPTKPPADFDPFFRAEKSEGGIVTSLQLTLFGVRMDEVTGRGSAIIAGPDGQQNSFGVGDDILPGVKLSSVAFDNVTIDRDGTLEQLFLEQSLSGAGGSSTDQNEASGDASSDGTGNEPVTGERLKTDIAFLPRLEDGRTTGLVLRSLGDASIFRSAGFSEGDILVAVNGQPITSADEVQQLFARASGGSNLSVSVERGGDVLPISIPIAK